MNKFVVNKFGLVSLTIIFILLYGYMNTFNNFENIIEVEDQDSSILNEADTYSHFLVDVRYTEEDDYYRVSILVKINSAFAGKPTLVPQIDIQQLSRRDLPDVYKPWIDIEE